VFGSGDDLSVAADNDSSPKELKRRMKRAQQAALWI
jgi:hypothetical protein